jgi:hypothetical protein
MLLGIWLFCGLVSSVVAINKGRSGCGWFTLGIVLGPLGFGLALIAGPNRAALDEHALKAGDMKMCPYCAELVDTGVATCPHCGQSV